MTTARQRLAAAIEREGVQPQLQVQIPIKKTQPLPQPQAQAPTPGVPAISSARQRLAAAMEREQQAAQRSAQLTSRFTSQLPNIGRDMAGRQDSLMEQWDAAKQAQTDAHIAISGARGNKTAIQDAREQLAQANARQKTIEEILERDYGVTRPGAFERVGKMLSGAAKGWAGGMAEIPGMVVENRGGTLTADVYERQLQELYRDRERTQKALEAAQDEAEREELQWVLDMTEREISKYEPALRANRQTGAAARDAAGALTQAGAADIERAKFMTDSAGGFLVDAAANAAQMGMDLTAAALTGGGAMVPMAVRSFGGAAQEGRAKGYSTTQQAALGLAAAATEVFSEKLFGGNPVYDTDAGLVNRLVNAVTGNEKLVRALASAPAEKLYEGLEEIVSGVLNPVAEYVITGNWDMPGVEALIRDGALGVATAVIAGGANSLARTIAQGPHAEARTSAQERTEAREGYTRSPDAQTQQTRDSESRQSLGDGVQDFLDAIEIGKQRQLQAAQEWNAIGTENEKAASTAETGIADYQKQEHHGNILDSLRGHLPEIEQMPSVKRLTGREFQKTEQDTRSLRAKVIDFFNSIGNRVVRPGFGEIALNTAGARDSLSHGYGKLKASTFAALPEVLTTGKLIEHNQPYEGHDYDSYIIAAPVEVGGEISYVGALVIKDDKTQRYKLHEVLTVDKKGNGAPLFQSESGDTAGPLRNDAPSGSLPGSPVIDAASPERYIGEPDFSQAETTAPVGQNTGAEAPVFPSPNIPQTGTDVNRKDMTEEHGSSILGGKSVGAAEEGTFGPGIDFLDWAASVKNPITDTHNISSEQAANLALQQGREATAVPKVNPFGRLTSKHAQTLINSGVTPAAFAESLKYSLANGDFSRIAYTDDAAISQAEQLIGDEGWDTAFGRYRSAVENGVSSKDITTLGITLYNNAISAEDTYRALDIVSLMVQNAQNTAQALQANRILNKLTPDTRLYMAVKGVGNIENEIKQRYGDRAPELKIDSGLLDEYRKALVSGDEQKIKSTWDVFIQSVADQLPSTWLDKFNAWRYLAMLGNPRTHIRNIFGNLGFAPVRATKDVIGAAIERTAFGKTGENSGRTKAVLIGKADKALRAIAMADYNNVEGLVQSGGKYNESLSEIEDRRTIFKLKPLETVRKFNDLALYKEDSFFSRRAYASALAGYLKANGISAAQFSSGEISGEKLNAARAYAITEAQKATYRDTNEFSKRVARLGKNYRGKNKGWKMLNLAVEGVFPFKKTPANILVRAVEYSPAELLKAISYDAIQVKRDKMEATEMVDHLASGLTGTGLMALGALLSHLDLITGGDDEDEEQQNFDELRGKQNFALTIGGKSWTLDWLAPEALPLFSGVELYRALANPDPDGGFFENVLDALTGISEPMLEMSMLSGIESLLSSLSFSNKSGLGTLAKAVANSLISQFIPTLFGQLERTTEPQREETFIDRDSVLDSNTQYNLGKALNKLPADYNQIPYIDAWGRTEETGEWWERAFNNFFAPWYDSADSSTPADDELQRLHDAGYSGVFPTEHEALQSDKIDNERMTSEEYLAYKKAKGQKALEYVLSLQNSEMYSTLSDDRKAKLTAEMFSVAGAYAKNEIRKMRGTEIPKSNMTEAQARGVDGALFSLLEANMDIIEPIDGNTDVTYLQKLDAITNADYLSEAQKWEMLDLYAGYDSVREAFARLRDGGFGIDEAADYISYRSAFKEATDADASGADIGALSSLMTGYSGLEDSAKEMLALMDGFEKMAKANSAGIAPERYYALKDKHDSINSEGTENGLSAAQKQAAWSSWVDSNSTLTDEEKSWVKENMAFYTQVRGEAEKYEDLTGAGLAPETANKVFQAIAEIDPLEGTTTVATWQKYDEIINMGLDRKSMLQSLKVYSTKGTKKDGTETTPSYTHFVDALYRGFAAQDIVNFMQLKARNGNNKAATLRACSAAKISNAGALWSIFA